MSRRRETQLAAEEGEEAVGREEAEAVAAVDRQGQEDPAVDAESEGRRWNGAGRQEKMPKYNQILSWKKGRDRRDSTAGEGGEE